MIPNVQHISLKFVPSFLAPCKMELSREEENWSFIVIIQQDDGEKNWIAKTTDSWYVDKIIELGRTVVNQALRDERVMLDGIGLRCSFTENGIQKIHKYRSPEQSTSEWFLAGAFLVRAQNLINDQELTNYIELLEGYFDRYPFKLFDETPRRLRIYGHLSSTFSKGLADLIEKVTNEQTLILDLTNLEGMGTIFYEQFEPLKAIEKLKVLIKADNDRVIKQVNEIGFKADQMEIL